MKHVQYMLSCDARSRLASGLAMISGLNGFLGKSNPCEIAAAWTKCRHASIGCMIVIR